MTRKATWAAGAAAGVVLAALCAAVTVIAPDVAAGGLMHPLRVAPGPPPAGCVDAVFTGSGVTLEGWRCPARAPRRGTLVFLHGVASNRAGVAGCVDTFTRNGLDIVAYDSRGHGRSGGDLCTYGFWEKEDLRKVLDTVEPGPVVLLGTSMGAAVALQEAADDERVNGIVAAEVFSDLRTVARERAPRILTDGLIRRAFVVAEGRGAFRVDEVSPVEAARRIHAPVLLIHGAADADTPADHSRRVLAALAGPKELLLVEGAGHNQSLRSEDTWRRIERWVDDVVERSARERRQRARVRRERGHEADVARLVPEGGLPNCLPA